MICMKKLNQPGKIIVADGEAITSWYFLRVAFLAVPWPFRAAKNPRGVLFKHYYLIQAINSESALNKAKYIIDIKESLDGSAKLKGKRVIYKRVGILDLEPMCEILKSGVEVFDESESDVDYLSAKRHVMSAQRFRKLTRYEKSKGKPEPLDVFWGKAFETL